MIISMRVRVNFDHINDDALCIYVIVNLYNQGLCRIPDFSGNM